MTNCAHCAVPIPLPTGRQARRRYCNERCRKAAWRRRHQHDTVPHIVSDNVTDLVPDNLPSVAPDIVCDPITVPTASRDAVPTPGGQHRCPHCHQPLAVISVVVPAAAAHIPTPEVIHISPT